MKVQVRFFITSIVFLAALWLIGCDEQEFLVINGCELLPGTSCVGVDLTGQDLEDIDLTGANFSSAIFDDARMSRSARRTFQRAFRRAIVEFASHGGSSTFILFYWHGQR